MQEKLEQPVSEPPSPRRTSEVDVDDLSLNVSVLREEVTSLRNQLRNASVICKCFVSVYSYTSNEMLLWCKDTSFTACRISLYLPLVLGCATFSLFLLSLYSNVKMQNLVL